MSLGLPRRAESAPAPRDQTPPERGLVLTGQQLRESLLGYAPAFLAPERHGREESFFALVVVLRAYALGSRTARRLMRERWAKEGDFALPSRAEAQRALSHLSGARPDLPYLVGTALCRPRPGSEKTEAV
jgi:hypothetical protein